MRLTFSSVVATAIIFVAGFVSLVSSIVKEQPKQSPGALSSILT
jgi:hypothetical protein